MVPTEFMIGPKRPPKPKIITSLADQPREDVPRISTGFRNLDEMFGGKEGKYGLAEGSVIQLGGQPGCGKSTLLAHIASFMKGNCLYVTSEESKRRLADRVRRVAGEDGIKNVHAISTLDDGLGMTGLCVAMRKYPAKVIIIDSLQGLRKEDITIAENEEQLSALEEQARAQAARAKNRRLKYGKVIPSKHSQLSVRDIALDLIKEANKRKLTMIMVCHLTKDGSLAGLKEIEHMVDCVAWFRGKPDTSLRAVNCSKNREGDTMVSAEFDMTEFGLFPRYKDSGRIVVPPPVRLSTLALDDEPADGSPPPLPPLSEDIK